MLRGLLMTMTVCLTAAMCAPTQGAFVVFAGKLTHGGPQTRPFSGLNNDATITAYFTPGGGPAAITSAVLSVGSGAGLRTWTFGPGDLTLADAITMTSPSTDNVNLFMASNSVVSTNGGFSFGGLDLNFDATATSGNLASSDWQEIYNANSFTPLSIDGFITLNGGGGGTYNFKGAAVPEPGSIALLSGLGLVFGVARRRRQARATAA